MKISTPENVGMSSERLTRIKPVLQTFIDQQKLAGIMSLVARKGEIVHQESVGCMDIESQKPIQDDTIFRIYSMTKPITSAAIMILLEEGKLLLSDPVSKFIPEFKNMKVLKERTANGLILENMHREISLRDLLTHSAGLSYGFDENDYIDSQYRSQVWNWKEKHDDAPLGDLIERLSRMPLRFQPGTAYHYSMAIDVLGYVVEVVSGFALDEFLKQRILAPLGMVDTDFYVPAEKVDRFSANYGPKEGGGLKVIDSPFTSHYLQPTKCPFGGGGLVSTMQDYYRFCQMLLNKGIFEGTRILGRKTVELMMINHLPPGVHLTDDPSRGFGLGGSVMIDLAAAQAPGSLGKFGWGGAANTKFWIDPQEEIIAILMLQFMPSDKYPVDKLFTNLVYQSLVD